MLKDYSIGLGNYLKEALDIDVVQSKRDTAFAVFSKHHDRGKVFLPFTSFDTPGDIELDTVRYNAFIHRVGIVVTAGSPVQKVATRIRAIPIVHPYTIDFWAPNRDSIESLQRTFWIAALDSPIVSIFHRETDRTYRVSLDVVGSVGETVMQDEDHAAYFNCTVNVNLGVWIRLSHSSNTIQKAIIEYRQSPENYILGFREYT